MKRWIVFAAALAYACGSSSSGKLRVTPQMTVTVVSGSGVSPLEPLVGQQIQFDIAFAAPSIGHDPEGDCPTTVYGEMVADKVATGATSALVQSNILGILPEWEAVLSVCNPTSGSSFTLRSDNQAGLGLIFTCFDLPPSALGIDGQGEPRMGSFMTTGRCDATLYDQLNSRLYGGAGLEMNVVVP
ncbi:MAG TPA: hypothetical protein VFQ65_16985 [Kofleriaceae bacterium]|nr:hypothetical protein [Kofleriaceae bacterium]